MGHILVPLGWMIGGMLGWKLVGWIFDRADERKRERENDARDITPR